MNWARFNNTKITSNHLNVSQSNWPFSLTVLRLDPTGFQFASWTFQLFNFSWIVPLKLQWKVKCEKRRDAVNPTDAKYRLTLQPKILPKIQPKIQPKSNRPFQFHRVYRQFFILSNAVSLQPGRGKFQRFPMAAPVQLQSNYGAIPEQFRSNSGAIPKHGRFLNEAHFNLKIGICSKWIQSAFSTDRTGAVPEQSSAIIPFNPL